MRVVFFICFVTIMTTQIPYAQLRSDTTMNVIMGDLSWTNMEQLSLNSNDTIIIDLPFLYVELLKDKPVETFIDTFDIMTPSFYFLTEELLHNKNLTVFGTSQLMYRVKFLSSRASDESLHTIDSLMNTVKSDGISHNIESLETYDLQLSDTITSVILSQLVDYLTHVQYEVLKFELLNPDFNYLSYWFYSNRNFIFITDDIYQISSRPTSYDFYISKNKKERKIQYKKMSKVFKINRCKLKKGTTFRVFSNSVLKLVHP